MSPPPPPHAAALTRNTNGALSLHLHSLARPFTLSFDEGALDRRAQQGGELLFKATGAARPSPPRVVDATAGLCREAFLMASAGAEVWAIEREEALFELASDALRRSQSPAAARLHIERADALERLPTLGERAEVVYLDPMFPHRQKSAAVAREAQVLQALAAAPPSDAEAAQLLAVALEVAVYRVVVKRPLKAPPLPGPPPTASIKGSVIRYDLYGKRKLV